MCRWNLAMQNKQLRFFIGLFQMQNIFYRCRNMSINFGKVEFGGYLFTNLPSQQELVALTPNQS